MFVEQICWAVAPEKMEQTVHLLDRLHHQMDASGGLIRSLAGTETSSGRRVLSLTFWKGWEDLSRFLARPRSDLLSSNHGDGGPEPPRPHHFEVLWEWPEEEVSRMSSESFWAFIDYYAEDDRLESLLDHIRQCIPSIGERNGFRSAGLWLDKNNRRHVVVATQWTAEDEPALDFARELNLGGLAANEEGRSVFRVKITDPYHVGVV